MNVHGIIKVPGPKEAPKFGGVAELVDALGIIAAGIVNKTIG